MYRVGLEAILGFTRRGDTLVIDPCVPAGWEEFTIAYRFGSSLYEILVQRPGELRREGARVSLDGEDLARAEIPLLDDGGRHAVVVRSRRDSCSPSPR
jgi:cellobiose phosphorylase